MSPFTTRNRYQALHLTKKDTGTGETHKKDDSSEKNTEEVDPGQDEASNDGVLAAPGSEGERRTLN